MYKSSFYTAGKVINLFSPEKIIFGVGASNQVGVEARALGGKKALIVTDPGLVKAGLVEGIRKSLMSEKVHVDVFDRVKPEPPARIVDECAQIVRDEGYDVIVGVGGGSSLDTAKGTSMMAVNEGRILDYVGGKQVPKKGPPFILLPTTAGTGAEVGRSIMVTDESDKIKKNVKGPMANVTIDDPLLTISMPPAVTADTGADGLVQPIESYVTVKANPFSDILAIEAIRLVANNLPVAYVKGNDIEARSNMMFAALLGGLAMNSAGLGPVHKLANILGIDYPMSHGRSVAVLLPYVMDCMKIGNLNKYAQIAQAMGENIEGLTTYEAAERSVSAVKKLFDCVNISTRLSDYGVSKDDLPKLVESGMARLKGLETSPRDLTEKDVRDIYSRAL